MSRRTVDLRGDDGAVTAFFAVIVLALLLVIGLVADGGAKVRASQRAHQLAAEAARAGGQVIDLDTVAAGDRVRVSPDQARQAATRFLAASGAQGSAIVSDDGTRLTVQVELTEHTSFLSLIGVTTVTGTGDATAVLVHGLTGDDS